MNLCLEIFRGSRAKRRYSFCAGGKCGSCRAEEPMLPTIWRTLARVYIPSVLSARTRPATHWPIISRKRKLTQQDSSENPAGPLQQKRDFLTAGRTPRSSKYCVSIVSPMECPQARRKRSYGRRERESEMYPEF